MKKPVILIVLLLALIIPLGLLGLANSETGSRWLLQQFLSRLPAQVSVASIEGRLLDGIQLAELRYQSDTETIAIKNMVFSWQPSALFSGTLKIVDVSLNGLEVSLGERKDQTGSSFDFDAELGLPLQLVIENFLLTNAQLNLAGQTYQLEKLQFSALTNNGLLKITSLAINGQGVDAALQGQIAIGKGFPFSLNTSWKVNAEKNGLWQGTTLINGDVHKLFIDNQLATPFKVALKGSVEDLLSAPRIALRGDWQNLVWPIVGVTPQVQSKQGYVEMAGLLDDYQLMIAGQLNQQYLSEASLFFNGKGSMAAMTINKLELKSTTGQFQLAGNVNWQDAPAFDLTANGQDFNPGILVPELPGRLTFSTHLQGKMAANALQLDADISKLSGQLSGFPVSANGKLLLNGDQLKVDALRMASGVNKLAVDGTLGQAQASLKIVIDMPNLATLWPNLGGSLQGDGQLEGAWKNPTVKFQAKAKRLHFAAHSVEQLGLDIDYHPEANKVSEIQVSANAVKTGDVVLSKVLLEGQGTPAKHSFKADIDSLQGGLSTALTGSLNGNKWTGEISRLDVDSQEGGRWRLKKNMGLTADNIDKGVDITFNEGCLVQDSASLCVQGQYPASGNLTVSLKATALPSKLMKAYLPEQIGLQAVINGEADIQRQKGVFSGSYGFNMPPATINIRHQKNQSEIALGASSVSGKIKGESISANFDLALVGQDYCRGQVELNLGKSQAVSGQILASVAEFSVIEPFLDGVSGLKGHFKADLNLAGSLKKPLIDGNIDLTEAAFDTAQAGLRDVNVHVLALGAKGIQIQGSAKPTPIKLKSAEPLNINGMITVDADLHQQKDSYAGNYRFAFSPSTSLSFNIKDSRAQMSLDGSSLSGEINGDQVSADLNVALAGQDHLRGKLDMNIGKSQALSGQFAAAINKFSLVEVFVPQLSGVKGLLKSDLTVGGTLQKPQVNGVIDFSQGAVDVIGLGLNIRDISFQALAAVDNPDRIQIKGSAKSGEGAVKLDGFADLRAVSDWPAELMLTGENFEVAKIPEAQIAVSPDLKIAFADGVGRLSGQLKVPKAIMVIKQLPENAVQVSSDEVIVGQEKAAEKITTGPAIETNVEVELGKQVSFSGQGLQTNLQGKLKITQTGGKMAMQGNVDMIKASYKRFGQDLTVRKGRFLFNGPVDNPWVDVEAIRLSKSKKVTAILSLSGPLQKPQTTITSEPSLPESEALAYLVSGGPLNQVSQSEGNMIAGAAISYGAGQLSWISEKFGIDALDVEQGETLQDTLLTAGQYLTPEFYVGAKVGLFNKQAILVLKHKITDKITVETQTGKSQRIKLNYEFDTN